MNFESYIGYIDQSSQDEVKVRLQVKSNEQIEKQGSLQVCMNFRNSKQLTRESTFLISSFLEKLESK